MTSAKSLTLVLMADTHGYHRDLEVPRGDVLIHAGDITQHGTLREVAAFDQFLAEQPHPHKVVIAGNHDFCFEEQPAAARSRLTQAIYLQDEAVEVCGVKVYGSPWQPWFYDWAFNLRRGPEIAAKWALIPADTQILVTHGPPRGFGDLTFGGEHAGCDDLLARVREIKPALHVFGHIHEGTGVYRDGGTIFVNASTNEGEGPPIVIDSPLS